MSFGTYYCSPDDVATVLSAEGVTYSLDDNRSGAVNADEIGFINDLLDWTQSKINFFISLRYQMTTVPGNTWIRWCHAVLTACQHMRRRGDSPPAGLKYQEDQYLGWLEEIRTSDALIPTDGEDDAKLLASSAGMSMSNMRIDHRYRNAKSRYVPRISTVPQTSYANYPRFPDNSSIMSP